MAGVETASEQRLAQVPTGVPGLDTVLQGGLVQGSTYLIAGAPGTGKTVLANHLLYAYASAGGRGLFATVLTEPHARMLAHLRNFAFFSDAHLGDAIRYVNIYDQLMEGGLEAALDALRRLVREQRATLLIVDGARMFEDFAPTDLDYRRFSYELNNQLAALGCTTLLLADYEGQVTEPIAAHVDGVLLVEMQSAGLRDTRFLHVQKFRGVGALQGRHSFIISRQGVEVFPRLETIPAITQVQPPELPERLPFGVPGLDGMLQGGVVAGSTTLVLGAPGAGKTISGLSFICAGAASGERGIIAGFRESPPQLIGKAEAISLPLGRLVRDGLVRILWAPPLEMPLDAWAQRLRDVIAEHQPRRLAIDALSDMQQLELFPERLPAFLTALTNDLRARGVTTVATSELGTLFSEAMEVATPGLTATMDNTFLLRYVELRAQLHRLISIVKTRQSNYDSSIREFTIGPAGMHVASTFESAEAVLTDVAPGQAPGGAGWVAKRSGEAPR